MFERVELLRENIKQVEMFVMFLFEVFTEYEY